MTVAHELLSTAASVPFEVVSFETDDLAPAGSIRVLLDLDEDDVEQGGLALIFALAVLSFAEARPAGSSGLHFDADDQWTVEDLVEHLRFRNGRLCVDTDYVRGRLMKTSFELSPSGILSMQVVNRGETARRWISMLQGHKPLALVEAAPSQGPFYAPSGDRLDHLEDWQAVHPERHWKPGRSAMLLAQRWGGAGGFPDRVREALDRAKRLRDLEFRQGLVEHDTPVPGRGAASRTDILVFARDPLGNDVRIAVEGKVDEGFDKPIGVWLTAGRSPRSPANRQRRVDDMLLDLCVDPRTDGVGDLPYQLVHRAWSAWRAARDGGARRAVFLVHSFVDVEAPGSDWAGFRRFAELLNPDGPAVEPGVPYLVQPLEGVEFWMVWVSDAPTGAQ